MKWRVIPILYQEKFLFEVSRYIEIETMPFVEREVYDKFDSISLAKKTADMLNTTEGKQHCTGTKCEQMIKDINQNTATIVGRE